MGVPAGGVDGWATGGTGGTLGAPLELRASGGNLNGSTTESGCEGTGSG